MPPRSSTTPTTTRASWPRAAGQLNPYKLGVELYRDIEERWNKGQFGKEWDECDDLRGEANWDKRAGPRAEEDLRGARALQRRHLHRRVPHRRTSAATTSCSPSPERTQRRYEIETREFSKVKEKLLFQLTNAASRSSTSRTRTTRTAASCCCATSTRGRTSRATMARETLRNPPDPVAPAGELAHGARRETEAAALRRSGFRARRPVRVRDWGVGFVGARCAPGRGEGIAFLGAGRSHSAALRAAECALQSSATASADARPPPHAPEEGDPSPRPSAPLPSTHGVTWGGARIRGTVSSSIASCWTW